jgi:two-component system, cell cycle sensor histidine kinase and response regulator CckA
MNVLIVDDQEINRYLMTALLKGNGHDVRSAGNGTEAMEQLKSDDIDLIISDILMPGMDGFELCREIKADARLRHIPFIIYTATYTGIQDEEFAIRIGADRFVVKPCEPNVFMEIVQDVMAGVNSADIFSTQPAQEEEVLKLYNERLVRKLEQKMLQLEKETISLRKAQEALRESESRFRLFAELAPVGIVISDHQEKVIYASKKFVDLFGYTMEDIPSVEKWWSLACPHEILRNRIRREWKKAVDEARRTHSEINPMEYPVICKDKSVRHVEFRMASTGELNVMIFTDITDRKIAEHEHEKLREQFNHAQKLESVGRLAGGVAHDYNNMLGVITGYTELAMEKINPDDPAHADLKEVLNAAKRSTEITRQLLTFARKQAISPKVLDLNKTVKSMLKMLRRLIGEDVDLAWLPESQLWPVKIDPSQIDQVLANLCVNARDAIAGVGKITIETENITFDEDYCADHAGFLPGDFVLLAISDDGCGMDKETLDSIFEPFFTTKDVGEGTGLGLATVYGIVKQNNGFINVYSEPEKGTTFKIYLPCHAGKTLEYRADRDEEFPMNHCETLLVVEDEPAIMKMSKIMLENLGYRVLAASTPGEAMRLAEKYSGAIHLLITDVVMPEMNGRDLVDQMHNLYPDIRVLFMSGYTSDVIAHRGILDQGVQFIQKPFSIKDIAAKIQKVLEQS